MAITFLFCLFLGRFFYIQVVWEDELQYLALDQWTREIPVVAERGKIFDRNGELLAGNTTAYTIYARANAVNGAENSAQLLSATLGLSYAEVLKKLTDKSKSEITVAKQVEKSRAERIEGLNLAGIYYSRDNRRFYPHGELAEQVLGFTSADRTGTTGLEEYYDHFLAGKDGEILYETDLVGVEIEGAVATYLPAQKGLNIQTTLDYRIQTICEEVLRKTFEEYRAKSVQGILLNPQTFEILAMVNLPSYDLNDVPRNDLQTLNELSRNRLACDIYEPGSTFKVITSVVNIQEVLNGNTRALSLNHVYPSTRTRSVDGTTIKCWSNHANGKHSNQTLAEALNNSCNPCFVDIALSLGKETFYDYLKAFHFGGSSGIDFSGEAIGMLLPESTVRNCDLARIGFGQTIAVSPLQLACATAAAVNGGYYYAPHLVKQIYSDDGRTVEVIEKKLLGRTVSEEASKILSVMLEGVVRDGSGKKAYLEGYRVAGKTGTAQKYEDGHIAQGKYVSSFVGYFPADRPEYLALIIVDEPQGQYYGSTVAAPCAGEIFQKIVQLKKIQPYV